MSYREACILKHMRLMVTVPFDIIICEVFIGYLKNTNCIVLEKTLSTNTSSSKNTDRIAKSPYPLTLKAYTGSASRECVFYFNVCEVKRSGQFPSP